MVISVLPAATGVDASAPMLAALNATGTGIPATSSEMSVAFPRVTPAAPASTAALRRASSDRQGSRLVLRAGHLRDAQPDVLHRGGTRAYGSIDDVAQVLAPSRSHQERLAGLVPGEAWRLAGVVVPRAQGDLTRHHIGRGNACLAERRKDGGHSRAGRCLRLTRRPCDGVDPDRQRRLVGHARDGARSPNADPGVCHPLPHLRPDCEPSLPAPQGR